MRLRFTNNANRFETDNWGPIYITKKKSQNSVQKWVAKVLRKLKPMEGDVVVEFA